MRADEHGGRARRAPATEPLAAKTVATLLEAEGAVDESVLPSEEDVQRLTTQETRAFRGRRQFPAASASTVEIS